MSPGPRTPRFFCTNLIAEAESDWVFAMLVLVDVAPDLGARGRAVGARLVDRPPDDGGRLVARQAEELGLALARALAVRRDDRVVQLDREERHVRARDLEGVRVEEAVRAEQDRLLARCPELLPEELGLRRQLPRDVDRLRVRRDAGRERREVGRVRLVHRFPLNVDARGRGGPSAPCPRDPCCTSSARPRRPPGSGAGAWRMSVGHPWALLVVVRHDAEEVPAARAGRSSGSSGSPSRRRRPSPPFLSGAVETWTSWLPAGPTIPRTAEFDASRSAT